MKRINFNLELKKGKNVVGHSAITKYLQTNHTKTENKNENKVEINKDVLRDIAPHDIVFGLQSNLLLVTDEKPVQQTFKNKNKGKPHNVFYLNTLTQYVINRNEIIVKTIFSFVKDAVQNNIWVVHIMLTDEIRKLIDNNTNIPEIFYICKFCTLSHYKFINFKSNVLKEFHHD